MSELKKWFESGRDRVVPRTPPVAPPDWMAAAFRFCRDGGTGLAQFFKPVPQDHLVARGILVLCVCGEHVAVRDREFVECPNGCRWFVRDGTNVWAARLPVNNS